MQRFPVKRMGFDEAMMFHELTHKIGAEVSNAWIQTYSGIAFYLDRPTPEMVRIEDIAHHLSLLNRYVGATKEGYSVAQHCCLGASFCKDPLAFLLHDAAEAYLGDCSGPLKSLLVVYRVLEDRIQEAVAKAMCVDVRQLSAPDVKRIDLRMRATEKRDLMGPEPAPWGGLPEPFPEFSIEPWSARKAEDEYLSMFLEFNEVTDAESQSRPQDQTDQEAQAT